MPQKLDVEEALTFLFTALDACNVRVSCIFVRQAGSSTSHFSLLAVPFVYFLVKTKKSITA